tara:strand:+ start:4947 stop:5936 length:990 start_codon:yes stop_codon:yes gene_type:complete
MNREFWKGRRVFVSGGTGMVGSWLVKHLLSLDAWVVVLVRDEDPQSELYRSHDIRRVSVVNGALEEYLILERVINEYDIETVFHLGAQTIVGAAYRSPLQTFEANIRGTYNLLEACRVHGDRVRRVIIASSDKAYGEQVALPYTEALSLNGRYPYEVSKSCADYLAQSYHHTYQVPVAIARCGNVYGGGDLNWSRIVPGTIRALLRGKSPVIRSDGTYVRDLIFVKDTVRAYMRMAECLGSEQVNGEAFNFSNESPLNMRELVTMLQELMQCTHIELDIRNDVKGEIHSQHLSAEKAKRVLAWEPGFTLKEGLRETIDWYRKYYAEDVS